MVMVTSKAKDKNSLELVRGSAGRNIPYSDVKLASARPSLEPEKSLRPKTQYFAGSSLSADRAEPSLASGSVVTDNKETRIEVLSEPPKGAVLLQIESNDMKAPDGVIEEGVNF